MTAPPTARTVDVDDLVAGAAATLASAGVPTPAVDARLLVEAAFDVDLRRGRSSDLPADEARLARLDQIVAERARRIPLQLLVGTTWFRHLRLRCRPGVFIPRPETEVVAGVAIDAARTAGARPVVVEPCTGTGAIALSVAAEVAGAKVTATDVSAAAVAVARENLAAVRRGDAGVDGLAAGASCAIVAADLLEGLGHLRGRVDVLVANPPYLPAGDRGTWAPEVADHEPVTALVGGPDGHEMVDRLLVHAATWLVPGGTVVIEIDERRGGDALRSAARSGLVDVDVLPDLTGADRVLRARRPPAPS